MSTNFSHVMYNTKEKENVSKTFLKVKLNRAHEQF